LVEEGLGREGVEDGSNILTVDHRNREIGRTAGTAEGIAEILSESFRSKIVIKIFLNNGKHIRRLKIIGIVVN
jgi:hypothetical protein